MEILSFAESSITPKVDLVKGHVDFALMGQALVEKYNNPDFADSYIRYEYAEFGEFEIDLSNPMGVDDEGNMLPLNEVLDDQGNPVDVEPVPQFEKFSILLNRKPSNEKSEPVTILYYGNYSVPQA